MPLTTEQQQALDSIHAWLRKDDPSAWMFYLGGYAGTGKTFLLQHLINTSFSKAPWCLAPTGKAASVLAKKLDGVEVHTVHHALYKPIDVNTSQLELMLMGLMERPDDETLKERIKKEKQRLAEKEVAFADNELCGILPSDVVIVDESSMVTQKMAKDLRDTGAKVLFVGDPGQLPPVKDSGFFSIAQPNFVLQTVQRQALDNPIIAVSMQVRQGKRIAEMESEKITKRPKQGYPVTALLEADQTLTGMNHNRRRLNRATRKLKGLQEHIFPVAGEKLICLKNQFIRGGMFVNGILMTSASDATVQEDGTRAIDLLYEGELLTEVPFYHHPLEVHYKDDSEQDPWGMRKGLCEFDYGYAITVHKSQGSEWDNVMLIDDGLFASNPRDRKRWLYTAVTRAKDRLIWLTS
jgi:exodeoxyribonuclease-5